MTKPGGQFTRRKRRHVPRWSLVVLAPFFRYNDWRDAWVLRLVGDKFGPVLVPLPSVPLRHRASAAVARSRWSTVERLEDAAPRTRSTVLGLVLAAVVVAAVLGFIIARIGSGGSGGGTARAARPPTLSAQVTNGDLQLSLPSGWKPMASPIGKQLGLSDVIAVAPATPAGAALVVGRATTSNPQLLPKQLLDSLSSTPKPQTVTLGHAEQYRYPKLVPKGKNTPESVYAMPTSVGTVVAVCVTPSAATSLIASCERSLATLQLTSGTRLALGPSQTYAATLNSVVADLNAVRARIGSQLSHAHSPKTQAAAATALAGAHEKAASTLSHADAGPASVANTAVVSALTSIANAYKALGTAASQQSRSAYSSASNSLKKATSALKAAYSQLGAFGYSVG